MPYAVPDGGICEVIFEGRLLNQQVMNVFHFRLDQAGGITDGFLALEGINDELNEAGGLHEKYMECMSRDYKSGRIRSQWILPQRWAYLQKLPTLIVGAVDATVVAPNVAVVMNKRTENAGPHSHGVTHLPAVPIDFVDAGKVAAIGFASYNAFKDKFLAGITTLGTGLMKPVIFNRGTPGNSEDVTNADINENFRTMHRRTVGLGA